MDPQKQKQILGYFIEEATDHLNTIESSLVNLQDTLGDPEMMNEVFRAAHSIKGGAAMLGITAMQHVSHNLEDSFKFLKDHPESKVDQELQSLLLYGVDTLKELLQQIENPSESNDQIAQEALANSEPLFAQLRSRIAALVPTLNSVIPSPVKAFQGSLDRSTEESKALAMVFRSDVPAKLRDMLQLFKQPDRPTSRQQLQTICDQLYQMGEQFDLWSWCDLIQVVKQAIANSHNSFRTLAPIIIREVKQAQESVLELQAIAISPQLKALMPLPEPEANIDSDDEISHIFGTHISGADTLGILEPQLVNWQKFGDRLQWRINGTWINSGSLNSSNSAPAGHFPAPIWFTGWDQPQDQNGSELQDQVHKLMAKIDQCGM
jgi:chemosensory pili system protein ChpA (sensor histidine kinase/response regulator)